MLQVAVTRRSPILQIHLGYVHVWRASPAGTRRQVYEMPVGQILDIGISLGHLCGNKRAHGQAIGKPRYRAPEQWALGQCFLQR